LLKITNIIIKSHVIIVAISVTSKTLFDFPIYRISVVNIIKIIHAFLNIDARDYLQ
jgi:hypothetical protein